MKSTWASHRGKKYFFARYDHMNIAELRAEIPAVQAEMDAQPDNSVLLLVDPRHTFISPEAVGLFKNVAKDSMRVFSRVAVLGISGPKAWLMDAVVQFSGMPKSMIKSFDDEGSALDWLVG